MTRKNTIVEPETEHVRLTRCGLTREDFDDDGRCADGGLPDEHPSSGAYTLDRLDGAL